MVLDDKTYIKFYFKNAKRQKHYGLVYQKFTIHLLFKRNNQL